MKDTHTPMEIEGKIVVVVNAPDFDLSNLKSLVQNYRKDFEVCTKYSTLEDDREYWQGKLGQQLTHVVTNDDGFAIPTPTLGQLTAIPKKQDSGDLWDEALQEAIEATIEELGTWNHRDIVTYLKQHYQLIKRKL